MSCSCWNRVLGASDWQCKTPSSYRHRSKHWVLNMCEMSLQRLHLSQGCQNLPSSILFWKTVQLSASQCNIETSYSTERNTRPELSYKIWETWAADLTPEDVSVYDTWDINHKTRIWSCLVLLQVGLCYVPTSHSCSGLDINVKGL